MSIEINNLIRSKRRTLALIVERDGSLTVRAPLRATTSQIGSFVQEKAGWIIRTREKLKTIIEAPRKKYADGEGFLFLGTEYPLKIVKSQRPALKFDNGFYLRESAQRRCEQVFTNWYKQRAFAIISKRVRSYAETHGFAPKSVRITSARTRWGSCSPDGTLNFTWRLVMAPMDVIDYVVVHELAHLRVKNHSAKFWKVVEGISTGYRVRRKWLRENGERLGL